MEKIILFSAALIKYKIIYIYIRYIRLYTYVLLNIKSQWHGNIEPFNQSLRERSNNYILKGPMTWLQWTSKTSLAPVLSMGAWQAKSSCTSLQPQVLKPITTYYNTCLRQRLPKPGATKWSAAESEKKWKHWLFPAPHLKSSSTVKILVPMSWSAESGTRGR